jgi:hypothetical protein
VAEINHKINKVGENNNNTNDSVRRRQKEEHKRDGKPERK